MNRKPDGGAIHIEDIQDQVELALMRGANTKSRAPMCSIARSARRSARTKRRSARPNPTGINVLDNGVKTPLDVARLTELVKTSCEGLADVDPERILKATLKDLYEGVPMEEVRKCRRARRAHTHRKGPGV